MSCMAAELYCCTVCCANSKLLSKIRKENDFVVGNLTRQRRGNVDIGSWTYDYRMLWEKGNVRSRSHDNCNTIHNKYTMMAMTRIQSNIFFYSTVSL